MIRGVVDAIGTLSDGETARLGRVFRIRGAPEAAAMRIATYLLRAGEPMPRRSAVPRAPVAAPVRRLAAEGPARARRAVRGARPVVR